MRILVVNVNTTASMTRVIERQARQYAGADTEIVGLTPFFGPESVEGNFESYLAAVAVMDRVLAYDEPYDAVVQAVEDQLQDRRHHRVLCGAGVDAVEPLQLAGGHRVLPRRARRPARPVLRHHGGRLLPPAQGAGEPSGPVRPVPGVGVLLRQRRQPAAVTAFVPSAVVSLTFALLPVFGRVAPFGWFIGCALGALIYYPIAKGTIRPFRSEPANVTVPTA